MTPNSLSRSTALALALGVLAGANIWLLFQFVAAVGAVLGQLDAPLIPVLAATGCGMMAGQALFLTWLLAGDLARSLRGESS